MKKQIAVMLATLFVASSVFGQTTTSSQIPRGIPQLRSYAVLKADAKNRVVAGWKSVQGTAILPGGRTRLEAEVAKPDANLVMQKLTNQYFDIEVTDVGQPLQVEGALCNSTGRQLFHAEYKATLEKYSEGYYPSGSLQLELVSEPPIEYPGVVSATVMRRTPKGGLVFDRTLNTWDGAFNYPTNYLVVDGQLLLGIADENGKVTGVGFTLGGEYLFSNRIITSPGMEIKNCWKFSNMSQLRLGWVPKDLVVTVEYNQSANGFIEFGSDWVVNGETGRPPAFVLFHRQGVEGWLTFYWPNEEGLAGAFPVESGTYDIVFLWWEDLGGYTTTTGGFDPNTGAPIPVTITEK